MREVRTFRGRVKGNETRMYNCTGSLELAVLKRAAVRAERNAPAYLVRDHMSLGRRNLV